MPLERLNVAMTTVTKQRLKELSKYHRRSQNGEINWLIDETYRAYFPDHARTLVDPPVEYATLDDLERVASYVAPEEA